MARSAWAVPKATPPAAATWAGCVLAKSIGRDALRPMSYSADVVGSGVATHAYFPTANCHTPTARNPSRSLRARPGPAQTYLVLLLLLLLPHVVRAIRPMSSRSWHARWRGRTTWYGRTRRPWAYTGHTHPSSHVLWARQAARHQAHDGERVSASAPVIAHDAELLRSWYAIHHCPDVAWSERCVGAATIHRLLWPWSSRACGSTKPVCHSHSLSTRPWPASARGKASLRRHSPDSAADCDAAW